MARRKSSLALATIVLAINTVTVDAFWRMSCSVIQTGRIDPIVSLNAPSSHVHKISGASSELAMRQPFWAKLSPI